MVSAKIRKAKNKASVNARKTNVVKTKPFKAIKTNVVKTKPFKVVLTNEHVVSTAKESKELYSKSRFGEPIDSKIHYSLVEALYLLERGKISIYDNNKKLNRDSFMERANKLEPQFWSRFCVFKNIRDRGYIVKTALKFGADFRVYDRGIKPGEDHAKWIVFPVYETSSLTWHEFAAKNRVAHSTKKRLLIAIVDDEGDCTFYEVSWIRP